MAVPQVSLNTSFLQSYLTTCTLAHIPCVVDSDSNSFLHMPCPRYLIFFKKQQQQQQKPSKIIISFRKPSIVLGLDLMFCLCCTILVLICTLIMIACLHVCLQPTQSSSFFSISLYLSVTDTYTDSHHRYDPYEESDWQIVSEKYILC